MADETTEEVTTEEVEPVEVVEGEESLADPGKKALDAMKAERNAARLEAKTAKAERDALKTERENAGKPAEELALTAAEKRGEAKATQAANLRLLKVSLAAAAKGKLADVSDAGLNINLDDFEIGDDGEIDSAALDDAIDALIARKPHLASAAARKFTGDADQGAKRGDGGPKQLTQPELDKMTPDQIGKALKDGRLNNLMGITN